MSIKLKVGEVDPPSVVMDVVNLPNPVYLGFTITAYNYDDVGLYFQITGSGAGYTFGTVNLGLIASGSNLRQNLDNFCNRARPASETSEQIQLILRAYTDAGYSVLKWTYIKTLGVWWIKSDDGSWTQDVLNNFDDGTVQGWAASCEFSCLGGNPIVEAGTDYVLSPAYSLRFRILAGAGGECRARWYKSFNTADKNFVLGIADIRINQLNPNSWTKYITVNNGGIVLMFLGKPYDAVNANYLPVSKWMRLLFVLPRNSSVEVRFVHDWRNASGNSGWIYINMDDFRIISKD